MTDTADTPKKDYRDTVFLPKTDFPMKAGLPAKEPGILARWQEMDLYRRLRENRKGRKKFILHDGPPYANGDMHIGHALNHILKDTVCRTQSLLGKDAPYVPGWDCHGLPIEWKVEEEYRKKKLNKDEVPAKEFRAECRAYAQHWVDTQREQLKRLGINGDWDHPYLTMDFEAEATIVAELMKFAESGQLYRGAKPVMWSPVEKTALAEAEVEYEDIVSTQIDVAFEIVGGVVQPYLRGFDNPTQTVLDMNEWLSNARLVVWTTTPWTIPVNQAIAMGEQLTYAFVETSLGKFIVAEELVAAFCNRIGAEQSTIRYTATGSEFSDLKCRHPMAGRVSGPLAEFFDRDRPVLLGHFVTTETGTGLVHMAPDHGEDDFLLCKANGIEPVFAVEGDGKYRADWAWMGGQGSVINAKFNSKEGQILQDLDAADALLASGDYKHSYPHSWRSKAKVIFRCTPQWFIPMDLKSSPAGGGGRRSLTEGALADPALASAPSTAFGGPPPPVGEDLGGSLRDKALAAIADTRWVPEKGRNRITAMVEGRPDWVISRQRAWGVPITLFVDRKTGAYLCDPAVNARIIAAVRESGVDAWTDERAQEYLGSGYDAADYERQTDILDVWFDSGCTHAFVLESGKWPDLQSPADLYLEGSDQHRGWFQSSLLESCGTRGRAPYKAVLTHGMTLDSKGYKQSKSLGNTTDPIKLMRDYGADIIRLWALSADFTEDHRIGDEILKGVADQYRKLRNTFRYLLGALDGFTEAERVTDVSAMPELERYVLNQLFHLDVTLHAAIRDFDFNTYVRDLTNFCNEDLSAFFFDNSKDRLYCNASGNLDRRAYRTVLDILFERLVRYAAPILVFTAEEVWQSRYPGRESIHLQEIDEAPSEWLDGELAARIDQLRLLREQVNEAIEPMRRDKIIGSSLQAVVTVPSDESPEFLAELFIVSEVRNGETLLVTKTPHHKCGRCWRHLPEVGEDGDLCKRCVEVVADAA